MIRALIVGASLMLAGCATAPTQDTAQLGAGDWVLAHWQEDRTYLWPATVTAREGDVLTLQYDDGDSGTQTIDAVRAFDWAPGTRLECRWSDDVWYWGTIAQAGASRADFRVLYDDGDKEATNTTRCRSSVE